MVCDFDFRHRLGLIAWTSVLLIQQNLFAAIPRSLPGVSPATKNSVNQEKLITEALRLPIENRVQALRSQGDQTANVLKDWAFDRNRSLEIRWRALTALPYLDSRLGQLAIEMALKSEEWYLRNAATIALPALDRDYAVNSSARLLSDPALVVRTAAVQNLLKLNAREKTELIWRKINSPENFRNGESLWVRRHMAQALAEFSGPGQEDRFIALLKDKDRRLHPFAIQALERIRGPAPKREGRTLGQLRKHWLNWAEQNSQTL